MHKGHNHARLDPTPTGVRGKVCIDASGWSTAPLLLLLRSQAQSLCQGSTRLWPARMGASGSHGGAGGQRQLPEGPSPPRPGGHEAAGRTAARSFPAAAQAQLAKGLAPSPHQSPSTAMAPWAPVHCTHPQQPCTAAAWEPAAWSLQHPSPQAPHAASHSASPETHTRLWGLCLNSLQMQKAQLDVFTHMAKEQLLTAAPAWPLFTPLFLPRQPASLLFLRSSFPRFCAALPRIPCTTQQPALLQSSPSLLLSHHFFGICCSQRSRN